MVAIGTGAQREVLSQIEEMGTNLIIVNAGQVQRSAGRQQIRGTVTTLTTQDADAVLRETYEITAAAPVQSRRIRVHYEGISTSTNIVGTSSDFLQVRNFHPRLGYFFTEEENIGLRRVAVLGNSVNKNLFNDRNPIGERIRIGNVPFEVIGVMESKGTDLDGNDQDDQVFIPINTALRRVFNISHINTIYFQAINIDIMDEAAEQIRYILREQHRLDIRDQANDFTIDTQLELLDAQRETTDTFTMLIGSIAGISLLVGGIGILAIMLISIKERTNEIGLRMAVGARRKDVLTQFLLEASMLGIFGGIAGIIIGVAGSYIVGVSTEWATRISLSSVVIAVGFSLIVGLFFGVYPARKASLLDPIDALRSE